MLRLMDDKSGQWIGTPMALYLLPGNLPKLNEGAACALLDIPQKKAADMEIRSGDMPEVYDTDDSETAGRTLIWDTDKRIILGGADLLPCSTSSGEVYFVREQYIQPIVDCEGLQLVLKETEEDVPYIVAKEGMFTVALLMPYDIGVDGRGWIGSVYNGARRLKAEDVIE